MPKELGERLFGDADTIPRESDGNGSAGDFVTFDANNRVTPVTAAGENIVGVLAETPSAAGDEVNVAVQGLVIGNTAGTVTTDDVLEPDGTNAGRTTANGNGTHRQIDEGGTAIYSLAMDHPRAYSDAGGSAYGHSLGTNEALVKLP